MSAPRPAGDYPLLADCLSERGVLATIRSRPEGVEVGVRAVWPFRLATAQGTGTDFTVTVLVDPRHVADDPERLADYIADHAERQMLDALLPGMLDRAQALGMQRRLLAPYARDVVDHIAAYARPGDDAYYLRSSAFPFTHADGWPQ